MDGAEGTWRFAFALSRVALAAEGWRASVTVEDEAESDNLLQTFAVNQFASAGLVFFAETAQNIPYVLL